MTKRMLGALLGCLVAIQFVGTAARSDDFADCVRSAADSHLAAKLDFQRDFRDLIVRERPAFESLATLNMEVQILLAQVRRAKFDHILAHDPERIVTTDGLSRFSNFEWAREDKAAFLEQSPDYRDMETRLSTLLDRNNEHPDWPSMREYFRSEGSQGAEFEALRSGLQSRESDVEAAIAHCRRG